MLKSELIAALEKIHSDLQVFWYDEKTDMDYPLRGIRVELMHGPHIPITIIKLNPEHQAPSTFSQALKGREEATTV